MKTKKIWTKFYGRLKQLEILVKLGLRNTNEKINNIYSSSE